jgi:hypothetical protein
MIKTGTHPCHEAAVPLIVGHQWRGPEKIPRQMSPKWSDMTAKTIPSMMSTKSLSANPQNRVKGIVDLLERNANSKSSRRARDCTTLSL